MAGTDDDAAARLRLLLATDRAGEPSPQLVERPCYQHVQIQVDPTVLHQHL